MNSGIEQCANDSLLDSLRHIFTHGAAAKDGVHHAHRGFRRSGSQWGGH
jgi:hypothetical protein